jgi:hypothetical protein
LDIGCWFKRQAGEDGGSVLGISGPHAPLVRYRRQRFDSDDAIAPQRDAQDDPPAAVGRVGLVKEEVAQAVGDQRLPHPRDPLRDVGTVADDQVGSGSSQFLGDGPLA